MDHTHRLDHSEGSFGGGVLLLELQSGSRLRWDSIWVWLPFVDEKVGGGGGDHNSGRVGL